MGTEFSLVDALPGLIWTALPDGAADFINRRWSEYTGMSLKEAIGPGWLSAIHPDDLSHLTERWEEFLASGRADEVEARLRRHDGVYRWFLFSASPVTDDTGRIVKWCGINTDIDDRKRAEELRASLASSERDLKSIINTLPATAWTTGPDGYVEFLSDRWLGYAGITAEEGAGLGWGKVIHPDDAPGLFQYWQSCLETGTPVDTEARMRRFDGEYRWFLFRANPLRDESGNIVRWFGTNIDIEDRKRADYDLRRVNRYLDEAQRLSLTGTVVADLVADEHHWSAEAYRIFEFDPTKRLTFARILERIHPKDVSTVVDMLQGTPRNVVMDFEFRLKMPTGAIKYIHVVGRRTDEEPDQRAFLSCIHDITERKLADQELRRVNGYLEEAQRLSQTGTIFVDFGADERHWSEEAYHIFGFDPAEKLTYTMARERLHPDDASGIYRVLQETPPGGAFDFEFRLKMPTGEVKYIHAVGRRMDEQPDQSAFLICVQDVTERKLAEQELRRINSYLEEGQRLTLTGTVIADLVADDHNWSEEAYRIFEFDLTEKLIFARIRERLHPDDISVVEGVMQGTPQGGTFDFECRLKMPAGPIKHIHVVGRRIDDQPDQRVLLACMQDITERKAAETELRRSQAFLAEGQRLSLTGSFFWRITTGEIIWSDEVYRIFGYEVGIPVTLELIGARVYPDDMPMMMDMIDRAQNHGKDFAYEHRLLFPDNSVKYLHMSGLAARDHDGKLEYVGSVQDITARRLAEDAVEKARSELAHVARVSALGTLTASITHEVNQPLSGIITNAGTCLRMLAADPPNVVGARETAERTIRDANRAAEVVARLRTLFTRKIKPADAVDLSEATREVLALVASELQRSRVLLKAELAEDLPAVVGDRVQLQQVILNLLLNAIDALSKVEDRPKQIVVRTERAEDGDVRVAVRDAGVGFDAQEAKRLFEAFHTTKEGGMGIGLSISRSIVENHNGRLWADKNEGPGATFAFSIPASSGNGLRRHHSP
jgi:PAS domain S-box-containing protein